MTGEEALRAFGYVDGENGRLVRPGRATQQWKATDGGWLRFEGDGSAMPHSVASEGVAGLDFKNEAHAEHFNWVWPDEEVARVYGRAAEREATGWADE